MTPQRIEQLERQQTNLAMKILDATPISEAWSPSQIAAEVTRAHGSRIDMRIVTGALDHLVGAGLVKEPRTRFFQRVQRAAVKRTLAVVESPPTTERAPMTNPTNEPVNATPLEKLANLSLTVRDAAKQLLAVAELIDEVAVEVEEHIKQAGAGAEKLRQLQALLKGLS